MGLWRRRSWIEVSRYQPYYHALILTLPLPPPLDLFHNREYDERDPEFTERQVWATRGRQTSSAQGAHVNVQPPQTGEPAQGGASSSPRQGTRRQRSPSSDQGQGPSARRSPRAHHLPDTSDAPDSEEDRVPVLKKPKLSKAHARAVLASSSSSLGRVSPPNNKGKSRAHAEGDAQQYPSGSTSARR